MCSLARTARSCHSIALCVRVASTGCAAVAAWAASQSSSAWRLASGSTSAARLGLVLVAGVGGWRSPRSSARRPGAGSPVALLLACAAAGARLALGGARCDGRARAAGCSRRGPQPDVARRPRCSLPDGPVQLEGRLRVDAEPTEFGVAFTLDVARVARASAGRDLPAARADRGRRRWLLARAQHWRGRRPAARHRHVAAARSLSQLRCPRSGDAHGAARHPPLRVGQERRAGRGAGRAAAPWSPTTAAGRALTCARSSTRWSVPATAGGGYRPGRADRRSRRPARPTSSAAAARRHLSRHRDLGRQHRAAGRPGAVGDCGGAGVAPRPQAVLALAAIGVRTRQSSPADRRSRARCSAPRSTCARARSIIAPRRGRSGVAAGALLLRGRCSPCSTSASGSPSSHRSPFSSRRRGCACAGFAANSS